MLAEIFMLRLEAAPRPSEEKLPSSTSQFVPLKGNEQFAIKEQPCRARQAQGINCSRLPV
jgi:hypothetical protein